MTNKFNLRRRALIGCEKRIYLIQNGKIVNNDISGGFITYPYRASYHPTDNGKSPSVTFGDSYIQLNPGGAAVYGVYSTKNKINFNFYNKLCVRCNAIASKYTYNQLLVCCVEELKDNFTGINIGTIVHGNTQVTTFDGTFTINTTKYSNSYYILFYVGVKPKELTAKIYDMWLE